MEKKSSPKVIIGMSGGVDSSVAAHVLLEQGYEVEGMFMRNWDSAANNDVLGNPDLDEDVCPQEQDYNDAKAVCDKLGIKLHRVDFVKEYWDRVFNVFLNEYKNGRTPNPDILCNKEIKFKAFLEAALKLDADYIAMGHYARVKHLEDESLLLRGVDNNKDQSYFLTQLNQKQLRKALFPIGDLQKSEVRKIALELELATASKKDSTGICFIGERNFKQFLQNYLPAQDGEMQTLEGDVLGRHTGLMYYTIGQRRGLGIGGAGDAYYVIGKNLEKNILYVGQGYHNDYLYSDSCLVEDVNIISGKPFLGKLNCTAKFRYRQADVSVEVSWTDESRAVMHVRFLEPVRAVTPGQACVLYNGDICLGGGNIASVFKNGEKLSY